MRLSTLRAAFFSVAAILIYANSSAQSWPKRLDYAGHDDKATAVTVDHQGNVLVVGTVINDDGHGNPTDADALCVSYAPDGSENWRYRYPGSAGGDDIGTGVAVDWRGNVYMCGVSYGGSTRKNDFFVLKIDSGGNKVWPNSGSAGTGTDFDNGALRLTDNNDDGVGHFAGEGALCAIASEDVPGAQPAFAITGPSASGTYNRWRTAVFEDNGSGGVQIKSGWPVDESSLVNDEDQSYAVAISPADHTIYVTGGRHPNTSTELFTTIRYHANGTGSSPPEIWTDQAQQLNLKGGKGKSIALDLDSNAFVTGYRVDAGATQYHTRKILVGASGTGDLATWKKDYEPYPTENRANSISLSYEVDAYGALQTFAYVTGQSQVYHATLDIATIRYAGSDGNPEWSGSGDDAKRYTGSGYDDIGMKVIASGNGNAYVIGFTGNGGDNDYVLLGYDKTGSSLFSPVIYDNGADDLGFGLALGASGNVYYTGSSTASSQLDFYTNVKGGFGTIDTIVPTSFSQTGGTQASGTVSNMTSSDDSYYSIRGLFSGGVYVDLVMEFDTTINTSSPQEISVTVESHTDKSDNWQKIEAYDYISSSWVLVSDLLASVSTDSSTIVTLPGDPARYIGPSNAAKIRVTHYVKPGYSQGAHKFWFDYVKWDVLH